MSEEKTTFLGLSIGCLLWIALSVLVVIGVSAIIVYYNYNLAVPVSNSERHVATCSMQYSVTQKAHIEDDLHAIRNANSEIAVTQDPTVKKQLQAQAQGDADDIYNALDASQCSRSQIEKDMPELQSFYQQFPNR